MVLKLNLDLFPLITHYSKCNPPELTITTTTTTISTHTIKAKITISTNTIKAKITYSTVSRAYTSSIYSNRKLLGRIAGSESPIRCWRSESLRERIERVFCYKFVCNMMPPGFDFQNRQLGALRLGIPHRCQNHKRIKLAKTPSSSWYDMSRPNKQTDCASQAGDLCY